MNIGELRNLLARYPDAMEVSIGVETGQSASDSRIELRDIIDRDTGQLAKTVLQIRHWNYGKAVGFLHLDAAERAKMRHQILDGLADTRRHDKWATRKFTAVHGDHRIYHHHGGGNDTCYGTAYDPRLFAELEGEGLVRSERRPYDAVPTYSITDSGMAELARGIDAEGQDAKRLDAKHESPTPERLGDAPRIIETQIYGIGADEKGRDA